MVRERQYEIKFLFIMKKMYYLWYLPTLMMVVLMSVGLASCGDDDDNDVNNGGTVSASIVGSWASAMQGKDYSILVFYANGTGTEYYGINSSNNSAETDNFSYTVDHSIKELKIIYNYGEVWKYKIKELTDQKLVLVDIMDDETGTFYRYTGSLPNNSGNNDDNGGNNQDDTNSLSAPSGISATTSGSSVIIQWNSVSGATKYNVYRSNSTNGYYSLIKTVSNTQTTDTNPLNGDNYYKITAVNVSQESGYSSYAHASISNEDNTQQKPIAPTGITVSNEGNNYIPDVVIRWNTVNRATKYQLYKSSSANGTYSKIGETTSNFLADNNAPTNGSAYYKVKAVNNAGESPFSNYAKYTPISNDEAFTPHITYGNCTVSGNTMTLRWTFKTGFGYGKATSVTLRVWNPYAEEWQDTKLSATATSTSFNIANKSDSDGGVKAGMVVENEKGSSTPGAKIYNTKTKTWLY